MKEEKEVGKKRKRKGGRDKEGDCQGKSHTASCVPTSSSGMSGLPRFFLPPYFRTDTRALRPKS